jgi:hypothetical protein
MLHMFIFPMLPICLFCPLKMFALRYVQVKYTLCWEVQIIGHMATTTNNATKTSTDLPSELFRNLKRRPEISHKYFSLLSCLDIIHFHVTWTRFYVWLGSSYLLIHALFKTRFFYSPAIITRRSSASPNAFRISQLLIHGVKDFKL